MPAQHPAGQVGDVGKAGFLQQYRGLGRPGAGPADGNHRPVAVQRGAALGQVVQGHQHGAGHMAQRPVELGGLAHIHDLQPGRQLFQRVRLDLPDPAEGQCQRRPGGFGRRRAVLGRLATAQVGRHRDVDQFGVGQAQVVHVAGEVVLVDLAAQARVVAQLLGDAGDGQAAVVVRGVQQARRRQRQDLLTHRPVQPARAALLEVGAATAADQQRITGEGHAAVVQHTGQAAVGVAGRGPHLQITCAERHPVAVAQQTVRQAGAGRLGQGNLAAAGLLEPPGAGDMVGMHMGV